LLNSIGLLLLWNVFRGCIVETVRPSDFVTGPYAVVVEVVKREKGRGIKVRDI